MNCIYQMWDGNMPTGEVAGSIEMARYADRIGARYRFDLNAHYFQGLKPSYGRFRVLHDPQFAEFDDVLYADTDVWPVNDLREDIFAGFSGDIGICTEPLQPVFRQEATKGICAEADEAWAKRVHKVYGVEMPRDEQGRLLVFNGGLQLWSRAGRTIAQIRFVDMKQYIYDMRGLHPFYLLDQNYLHAMMVFAELKVVRLDNDWNRYVHYQPYPHVSDQRTPTTKMVHVQLRGAGNYDADKLRRIVNRPQEEWNL